MQVGMFGRPKSSPTVAAMLKPIEAVSPQLARQCIDYVDRGTAPEILLQFAQQPNQDLDEVLLHPGYHRQWRWIAPATKQRLCKIGLTDQQVRESRLKFYTANPTNDQLVRTGRLLASIGTKINRSTPLAPDWLTTLTTDLVMAQYSASDLHAYQASDFPLWTPYRLAELLRHDDPSFAAVAPAVAAVLFSEDDGHYDRLPAPALARTSEWLVESASQLTAESLARLDARNTIAFITKVASDIDACTALAPTLATWTTHTAKTVRTAAVAALRTLDPQRQIDALRPPLATVTPARATELINYLNESEWGLALLNEAVANGAKVGAAVEKLNQRQQTLSATTAPEPELRLPDYEPLPAGNDELAAAQLRSWLNEEIAAGANTDNKWVKAQATRARGISDAAIATALAVANGTAPAHTGSKLANSFGLSEIANAAPALSLAQLIRLHLTSNRHDLPWAARFRVDEDTDLRALSDVCTEIGISDDWVGELVATVGYKAAWPWFATRPERLQQMLGDSSTAAEALWLLAEFPQIPNCYLPSVATIATSDPTSIRRLAQAVLLDHPGARALAEQALGDGKVELRQAAAEWLAKIGDPAAIPALTAALGREKREVARAAILNALKALGSNTDAYLSPSVLLAEAKAGLKAKPPASLGWFLELELPPARWADGSPVEPVILRWWTVLATKMKNPDGSGLLDLYLGLLDPDDAAALSSFVLRAWIAQDTRRPNAEESRSYAERMADQRYESAQKWLVQARQSGSSGWLSNAEEAAILPREYHYAEAYRDHQSRYLGSASAEKGLLGLTTKAPGIELSAVVAAYIRNDGSRRAQVEYLVCALYANGQPAAIQLLLSIARRHKQATVQAKAKALVEQLAEDRGWSADELADRTIPTAGFSSDRLLHLDFGPREFLGRMTAKATIELSDADGKPIKTLPNPRQNDDAELAAAAKKQLTTSRKELKAVLVMQTSRLYEAMCAQRAWPSADWTEFLAEHPLMAGLITRLVWLEEIGGTRRSFRPTDDGSLIDADDEPVTLAAAAQITVAHRSLLTPTEVEAWQQHLTDYDVTALFSQFGPPAPEFDEHATEFADLAGHVTDTFSFRNVATKRGYTRGAAEDGGWFGEYTKALTGLELTAVVQFTGSYLPEDNISCATEKLYFRRGRKRLRLRDVPPILVAECYADYAALAALGAYDPDYLTKTGA